MHVSSPNGLHMMPRSYYLAFFDWFARVGAVLVAAVGVAVIIGWLWDIALLKSMLPGLASMKVNTAYAFLAAGTALWFVHTAAPGSQALGLARALAVIVAAFGGLTLAEDLFGLELGIDQLILPDAAQAAAGAHPGRMSPAAALNFLFVGFALIALRARQPRLAACAHWLAVPPLFISTLAIVGYAFGVSSLYELRPYISMAINTALAFFVLALSILAADPAHGAARIASSDTAGGIVVRRLLPTIPVILLALGWACLAAQQAGLYDARFGLALMVLLSITVSVVAVVSIAVTLHRVDVTRKRAEAEIMSLNAGLERRVEERTRELARLSAELSAANKSLEQLSLQDGLTDLANRRSFDQYLAGQMAVARRYKRPLALVMCDVDAFKAYNDCYGHQAGDACLKQIAGALRSCCRRPADLAARYGGEEFALILPDTDLAGAAQIAETAVDAIRQLRIAHAHSPAAPYVSISGGVAGLLPHSDMSAGQLIKAADEAMYQAKHLGRNRAFCTQAGRDRVS
jgi:diguanylate cyclase (GGDEF)-like protein